MLLKRFKKIQLRIRQLKIKKEEHLNPFIKIGIARTLCKIFLRK